MLIIKWFYLNTKEKLEKFLQEYAYKNDYWKKFKKNNKKNEINFHSPIEAFSLGKVSSIVLEREISADEQKDIKLLKENKVYNKKENFRTRFFYISSFYKVLKVNKDNNSFVIRYYFSYKINPFIRVLLLPFYFFAFLFDLIVSPFLFQLKAKNI